MWHDNKNIKMDVTSRDHEEREESVEDLINKLNAKGTKIKIIKEGEDVQTPQRSESSKLKKKNNSGDDKENINRLEMSALQKQEIENIQRQNEEMVLQKQ